MNALTYQIYLAEPVLATRPQAGEPNSAESYPYIPGSMIRGALIAAYLNKVGSDNLATDDVARRLFFDGDVRYLNAYLVYTDKGARLLPTPLSWFIEKEELEEDRGEISDLAVKVTTLRNPKAVQGHKRQFCHAEAGVAYLGEPERQVNVHNASIDRNTKTQGPSQVYRYEALAAGQILAGVILGESADELNKLKEWLEQEVVFLGGSHTGGYGRVEIRKASVAPWKGEYQPGKSTALVIVTLLSDLILRPPNGDLTAAFLDALGLNQNIVKDSQSRAYFKVGVVGGFNRKWGLPLPQDWALLAGSVFCFPADLVGDLSRFDTHIANGLGERRTEGFGRIAINWHTEATWQKADLPSATLEPVSTMSAASQVLAKRMAGRLLRQHLEKELMAAVNREKNYGFNRLPSASQLSRVRLAARHALFSGDSRAIVNHVDNLRGAKADWHDARIGEDRKPLLNWIRETAQLDEENFAERFGLTGRLPIVGGIKAELTSDLRHEYSARLVDGVMKLAVEQAKKEKEQGGNP